MDHIDEDGNAAGSTPGTEPREPMDYVVGHGNPPMITRFKSGLSGNPKGRPKGSKNHKTIVRTIMNEMHAVTEDGRRQRRSALELMLLALRNLAAAGNVRAFRAFVKFQAKYEPQDSHSNLGYLVVPAGITQDEAIARNEKLNEEACAKHEERCRERDLARKLVNKP